MIRLKRTLFLAIVVSFSVIFSQNNIIAATSYPISNPANCVSMNASDRDGKEAYFYFWWEENSLFIKIVPLSDKFLNHSTFNANVIQDGIQSTVQLYGAKNLQAIGDFFVPFQAKVGLRNKDVDTSRSLTFLWSPDGSRVDIPGIKETMPACSDPTSDGDGGGGGGCYINSVR